MPRQANLCPTCGGTVPTPRPDAATSGSTLITPPPSADRNPATLPFEPHPDAVAAPVLVVGYEILGELGRGGMGVVYKARQTQLNRIVALKMILAAEHAGPATLARFRNEGEAVARLMHPNIVHIYEVGEQQGRPFFTLEFVEGGNLEKKLGGTPQPPAEAARLIETLARAIQAAHEAGVVHRDLKPANVLLTPAGEPKVTDFGLAKQLDSLHGHTESGAILGTPSYMAPEQAGARSTEIGPATDVYSLGTLLYECLTGRPPFKGATTMDTVLQVLGEEPVPPSRLLPKVPRDLETVCLKCLQKDPRKRYDTAADLAADLRRFLAGEPILARPTGPLGRLVKWARRRPAVAALSAAVVLVTALAFGLVTAALVQIDEKRREAEHGREQLRATNEQLGTSEGRLQKSQQETLYASYLNGVSLAHQLWLANNVPRVREVLAACPKEYRRWEWHYLDRLCRAERYTVKGAGRAATAVAFSPDGRLLVAAGTSDAQQDEVRVFEAASGRELLSLRPGGEVPSAAFRRDGKRLALAALRGVTVLAPDPAQPAAAWARQEHPLPFPVSAVHYTPAGRLLAACRVYHGTGPLGQRIDLAVFDVVAKQEVCRLEGFVHPDGMLLDLTPPAFSPDGRLLAALAADSGRRTTAPDASKSKGNNGGATPTAKGFTGQIKVWDLDQRREERDFAITFANLQTKVVFSPDGKLLAWGDGGAVRLAEVGGKQEPRTLGGRQQEVHGVAFSPDGALVAATGEDGTVGLWDVHTGEEELLLRGHTGPVLRVAFAGDGRRLATGGTGFFAAAELKCWDLSAAPLTRTQRGPAGRPSLCLALSPDGGRFARLTEVEADAGKGAAWDLSVHDLATSGTVFRVPGLRGELLPFLAAFSPGGRQLAVCGPQGVTLYEAATGGVQTTIQLPPADRAAALYGVAYTSAGDRLATALLPRGEPGGPREVVVHLWDAKTGKHLRTFRGPVLEEAPLPEKASLYPEILFGPGDRQFAVAVGGVGLDRPGAVVMHSDVQVWSVAEGRRAAALPCAFLVQALAFHPDGRLALGGGTEKEGRFEVWDLDKRQAVVRSPGHTKAINGLAFSPDGTRLVTAGGDKVVKVWDAGTGKVVLALRGLHKPVTAVAFSANGRRLVAGTGMEFLDMLTDNRVSWRVPMEVRVWDAGE